MVKRKKPTKNNPANESDQYLSTGSTLLNLAISGHPDRGYMRGKYYLFVGDSMSGKTFFILTCLAEASLRKDFDDYRFIFDNAEDGALMDIGKFFGKSVEERIEPPMTEGGNPIYSNTIEEFYYHVDDAFLEERPFIYILDSMDALSSDPEQSKFDEQKEAHRKGKSTTGTFGDGKAKINSSGIRKLLSRLKKTGSILIVVNQTRDNLGFGFEKKTRSGGRALTFYATLELWSSIKGKIKRTVRGKQRQIGVECSVRVKKNRIKGRDRTVQVPIYHSFGIDDVGSCIDYLLEENHWKVAKSGFFDAIGFGGKLSRDNLIKRIEREGEVPRLREIVTKVWNEIEDACVIERKARY